MRDSFNLWVLAPALWCLGMLAVGIAIWRRKRAAPKRKSLAERFIEANPGIDMDLKGGGKTYKHRPAVLDRRE
jgi:hypothetical protein